MVVPGDVNARVANEVIGGIVEQYGVPGRNEMGDDYWRYVLQELVHGWQHFVQ